MNTSARHRPSIVRRAAIARGFEDAIKQNMADIAREQTSAAEIDSHAFREFSQQVALATSGPCLRYSQRLKLIDLAERGGITRFDANLVIAAIEHRANRARPKSTPKTSTTHPRSRALLFSTALAVQIAIVLTTWLALSR